MSGHSAEYDASARDALLYEAWVLIANARDWNDNPEWEAAAVRWRDKWHDACVFPSGEQS